MELQKISKRFQNLEDHLEKAYTKDIKKIIENVFKEYTISYKGTSDPVSEETFLKAFLFDVKEEIPICLGISQNGNKCCRRSQPYSNYCKMHFYLEFKNRQYEKSTNESIFIINNENNKNNENFKKEEKIFIEDSFYYKDDKFIYDTITLQKVGYIDDTKFILTDDPFILE